MSNSIYFESLVNTALDISLSETKGVGEFVGTVKNVSISSTCQQRLSE